MPETDALYIITGSTGALGSAFVAELTARGHQELLTASTSCEAHSGRHIQCDLSQATGAAQLRERAETCGRGRIHILNCVGFFPGYLTIADGSGELFERSLRCNLLSVYNVAHELLPLMQRRGGGHFIAFSPHTMYQAYPLMALFDAAKAGVEQLIRQIANEYSEHNVIANAIALATLNTDEERRLKPYGDHQHWLEPTDVARRTCDLIEVARGPAMVNGNVLHMFRYSATYFHEAYFDRIRGAEQRTPHVAMQKPEGPKL